MNLATQLVEAVDAKRKRIVVIGDTMIDHWVHGHLSDCQDNCQKFVEESRCSTPGGAANAANCLINWDVLTSCFGQDDKDRPEKCRFINVDGKITFRWDRDVILSRERYANYAWSRASAQEMVGCAAGVLLSDYDKGYLSPEFIQTIIGLCRLYRIPCVADVKREPELYAGAIIKGNADWVYRHKINLLHERMVITNGNDPPGVEGRLVGNRYSQVSLVNHVGAGDCFAAHLTLALAYGFSLQDAAAVAHSAGRVYIQHPHNRPPMPSEIADDMKQSP